MNVMLVEDHAVLRQGLRTLLETACGARVICDVGSAEEGVDRLKEAAPDLVILDLSLPGRDGIWALRQIKKARPETRVIILSMHTDDEIVARAFRAGADGYVIKSAAYTDLSQAIAVVQQGGTYVHPELGGALPPAADGAEERNLPRLSHLEREFLRLLGQGLGEEDLGHVLGMPANAVPRVLASLAERLGVAGTAELRQLGLRLESDL